MFARARGLSRSFHFHFHLAYVFCVCVCVWLCTSKILTLKSASHVSHQTAKCLRGWCMHTRQQPIQLIHRCGTQIVFVITVARYFVCVFFCVCYVFHFCSLSLAQIATHRENSHRKHLCGKRTEMCEILFDYNWMPSDATAHTTQSTIGFDLRIVRFDVIYVWVGWYFIRLLLLPRCNYKFKWWR